MSHDTLSFKKIGSKPLEELTRTAAEVTDRVEAKAADFDPAHIQKRLSGAGLNLDDIRLRTALVDKTNPFDTLKAEQKSLPSTEHFHPSLRVKELKISTVAEAKADQTASAQTTPTQAALAPANPEDTLREIVATGRPYDAIKRDLGWWAKGEATVQQGDVAVSSSAKSAFGKPDQPGFHYVSFKTQGTVIELCVHDASGDVNPLLSTIQKGGAPRDIGLIFDTAEKKELNALLAKLPAGTFKGAAAEPKETKTSATSAVEAPTLHKEAKPPASSTKNPAKVAVKSMGVEVLKENAGSLQSTSFAASTAEHDDSHVAATTPAPVKEVGFGKNVPLPIPVFVDQDPKETRNSAQIEIDNLTDKVKKVFGQPAIVSSLNVFSLEEIGRIADGYTPSVNTGAAVPSGGVAATESMGVQKLFHDLAFGSGWYLKEIRDIKGATFGELGDVPARRHGIDPSADDYTRWLKAAEKHLRISENGDVVVEDDNKRQFLLNSRLHDWQEVNQPLNNLYTPGKNAENRELLFRSLGAVATVGRYNPEELKALLPDNQDDKRN